MGEVWAQLFEELADASLCKILGITCQHASSELHGPKRVDAFPCDLVFRTRGCVSVQDAEQAQLIETLGEIRPDTRILLPKRGQPALISPRRQAEKRSSRASVRNVIRAHPTSQFLIDGSVSMRHPSSPELSQARRDVIFHQSNRATELPETVEVGDTGPVRVHKFGISALHLLAMDRFKKRGRCCLKRKLRAPPGR